MQWMANGIRAFTVIDNAKNPSEELIIIVSWITGALSDISKEMIE